MPAADHHERRAAVLPRGRRPLSAVRPKACPARAEMARMRGTRRSTLRRTANDQAGGRYGARSVARMEPRAPSRRLWPSQLPRLDGGGGPAIHLM